MTARELIELLKQHDPDAVVALRYDCDDNGVITCEELRSGHVQAAQLRRLQSKDSWFDPLAGAQLYRLCEEEDDDIVDAVNGVLLG